MHEKSVRSGLGTRSVCICETISPTSRLIIPLLPCLCHMSALPHRYTEASQVPEKPKYGCYVSGMYLEGAGWDHVHSHLTRQDPKILVTELPILQIVPIEANKLKLANTFRAPVYVTQVWCACHGLVPTFPFWAGASASKEGNACLLDGCQNVLNSTFPLEAGDHCRMCLSTQTHTHMLTGAAQCYGRWTCF